MATSTALNASVQAELTRRHKTTAKTVLSLVVAVILLCVLAFVSQKFLTQRTNPSLDMAVRISILIFGLGAIALRRTQFAKMRLQDIAGASGRIRAIDHLATDDPAGGNDRNSNRGLRLCCHASDRDALIHLPGRSGCGGGSPVWLPSPHLMGTVRPAIRTHRKRR